MNPNAKSFFPNIRVVIEIYVNPISNQKVIFNETAVNKPKTKKYII